MLPPTMSICHLPFEDILTDLSARFIINVPEEELASVERVCFQIEQAHWFYEDFVRDHNPHLPSLSLKKFTARMFAHCPLLHQWAHQHEKAYQDFLNYKFQVPVCGAIILNPTLDRCLLVKGWAARSTWGFPRGKINQEEAEPTCAVREVLEETGFDIRPNLNTQEFIEMIVARQRVRLYIVPNVPEDTVFVPQTRKEISQIEWHTIRDLPMSRSKKSSTGTRHPGRSQSPSFSPSETESEPTVNRKFYLIAPFIGPLQQWIARRRQGAKSGRRAAQSVSAAGGGRSPPSSTDAAYHSRNRSQTRSSQRPSSRQAAVASTTAHLSANDQAMANINLRRFLGIPGESAAPVSPTARDLSRPQSTTPSVTRSTRSRSSRMTGRIREDATVNLKMLLGINQTSSPASPAVSSTGNGVSGGRPHRSATASAFIPPSSVPSPIRAAPPATAGPQYTTADLLAKLQSSFPRSSRTPSWTEPSTTAPASLPAVAPASSLTAKPIDILLGKLQAQATVPNRAT
ncbi:mRNA-decapping enzyme subunit 2 [Dimargaris cristalligena]|nr:mRNA-decapping enzyme subunit 2 [Dimargaris cristalligena]